MVTPKGQAKVLDFGLAKLVRPVTDTAVTESLTETPAAAGTLPYMAPEQLQGQPGGCPDRHLRAGPAVLYQMATGRRPFPRGAGPTVDCRRYYEPSRLSCPRGTQQPEFSGGARERIILKCSGEGPRSSATSLPGERDRRGPQSGWEGSEPSVSGSSENGERLASTNCMAKSRCSLSCCCGIAGCSFRVECGRPAVPSEGRGNTGPDSIHSCSAAR